MSAEIVLEVVRLGVRFGATVALREVDLDLRRGEVHALVGENGAGKSTLMRAVAGVVRPHEGTIRRPSGTRLAWVPQETELPADLRVGEWIFLGRERRGRLGWLRRRAMHEEAGAALQAVGCDARPAERLGALGATQRKQVQLARALHAAPDLLLLDEPTAVLGAAEARRLFDCVRSLSAAGTAVLYVSHRLEEVLALAGRVTVLRDGCRVSTDPIGAVDVDTLVRRMVGREIAVVAGGSAPLGEPVLQLDGLAVAQVRGLSLTVREGEVVGLAGLVGAGRSEILEGVMRLRPLRSGRVHCLHRPAFVPEDRARKGLIPTLGLRENVFLPVPARWIRRAAERRQVQEWIRRLAIRAAGTEARVDSLSGGNQQKVLLARALRHRPRLLLLDEPTAGVDVGAKAEIHDTIRRLAAAGTAVLLASSELPELLALCGRIVALYRGAVAGVVTRPAASEESLAALITGTQRSPA